MIKELIPRFVSAFPDQLESGVLYVAPEFATMTHLCCCGCRQEVVTPLSPKDWKIIFDGETISVSPSIGSWSLPCRSHYIIRQGRIVWAGQWTQEQIAEGRRRNLRLKRDANVPIEPAITENSEPQPLGLWVRIQSFFK